MGFLAVEDALFEPTTFLVGGVSLGISGISLLVALFLSIIILLGKTGDKDMNEVASAIRKGALAFMTVEYLCLSVFAIIMFILISITVSWQSGICYIVGSILSGSAGFFGMIVATQANVRTTHAAKNSLSSAMRMAFNGGSVMGLCVAGVGLGGLSVFYLIFGEDAFNEKGFCAAFGLGVTSVSLFARVGGGIFTKAADVGADLVGKVETGLPEDDARNPATIADNVGDNVGDIAGMGADLCGSFVGSIICSCLLGFEAFGLKGVAFPIWVGSAGIICSIIGQLFVRCRNKAKQVEVLIAFRVGQYVAGFLLVGASAVITYILGMPWFYLLVIALGLICGIVIAMSTEFFTSPTYMPTRSISHAAGSAGGAASVVIQGLAVGMYATVIPAVAVAATLIICVVFGGMYGAALASTGLLGCLSFTLSTDCFGAIADNAGGIAEMCELDEEVRERTDVLDALGNTTAAVGKGYAIGSALLTGISLCSIFSVRVGLLNLDVIGDPYATAGVLIGAMMPFFFSALTMGAVSTCAQSVFDEVRRQLREIPGIMDRTQKPDYAKLVVIVTGSSIHAMIGPGTIALLIPLCTGIWFRSSFLGGMLIANTACGFMLSTMMATSGGSWDNAKKHVESGHYGGKHSEAHKATVVGDTIGDPFKDTSGPAINILIKLVTYTGVVLAPVYKEQASFWWAGFIIFFGVLAILLPIMIASPTNLKKLKKWIDSKRGGGAVNDADSLKQVEYDDAPLREDDAKASKEMNSLPPTSPPNDDEEEGVSDLKMEQEKQQALADMSGDAKSSSSEKKEVDSEEDNDDKGKQVEEVEENVEGNNDKKSSSSSSSTSSSKDDDDDDDEEE